MSFEFDPDRRRPAYSERLTKLEVTMEHLQDNITELKNETKDSLAQIRSETKDGFNELRQLLIDQAIRSDNANRDLLLKLDQHQKDSVNDLAACREPVDEDLKIIKSENEKLRKEHEKFKTIIQVVVTIVVSAWAVIETFKDAIVRFITHL